MLSRFTLVLLALTLLAGGTTDARHVVGWKAWYAGEAVYDSRTTTWEELPNDGVVFIMLYMNTFNADGTVRHRRQMSSNDWYFRAPAGDDFIYGHNNDTPEENARRFPGVILKRGKWVTDAEMEHDSQEAMDTTWED